MLPPPPPPPRARTRPASPVGRVLLLQDPWAIVTGNVLDGLREVPDNTIHHITTSPPYWSLRDYGSPRTIWGGDPDCDHDWVSVSAPRRNAASHGKAPADAEYCAHCRAWNVALGMEPSPELFAYHLVLIFREARRALHPKGTMILNLGDSFYGASPIRKARRDGQGDFFPGKEGAKAWAFRSMLKSDSMKAKDRVLLPHMVAQAMRQPWVRCNKWKESHFMWWGEVGIPPAQMHVCPLCGDFAGYRVSEPGWYIRMDGVWSKTTTMPDPAKDRPPCAHEYLIMATKEKTYYWNRDAVTVRSYNGTIREPWSVWTIPATTHKWDFCKGCQSYFTSKDRSRIKKRTEFSEEMDADIVIRTCPECGRTDGWLDHFAMFPPQIPQYGIAQGTPDTVCADCGEPYDEGECPKCGSCAVTSAIVADLFNGGGTTGIVARGMFRRYLGFEQNPDLVALASRRFQAHGGISDLSWSLDKATGRASPPTGW